MECEERKNAVKAIDQISRILQLTERERKEIDVNVQFDFNTGGE